MITLAVDGRGLWDGSERRGIGVYLTHLLEGLAASTDVRPVVIAPRRAVVPLGVDVFPVRRSRHRRLGDVEHELLLPGELRRTGADIVHSPAQHPPRRSPVPWVQTIHDLIPLSYDDPLYAPDRRRWHRLAPRLRRAAAVIADSAYSARQVVDELGVPTARVHVIPLAADSQFGPGGRQRSDPPYLLYVGAWGPHKGFAEAFAVVAALADAGLPHTLKVAGAQDPWMAARVDDERSTSARPDRVDVLGYVGDLAALYRGADAVLVTSRAEGFGLPALEAMACGVPVVAFANTAIPEVVGDGGVLVADGDVPAMVAEVRGLLVDERRWEEQSQRGLARATGFSWTRTVQEHVDVYRAVSERSR